MIFPPVWDLRLWFGELALLSWFLRGRVWRSACERWCAYVCVAGVKDRVWDWSWESLCPRGNLFSAASWDLDARVTCLPRTPLRLPHPVASGLSALPSVSKLIRQMNPSFDDMVPTQLRMFIHSTSNYWKPVSARPCSKNIYALMEPVF